METSEKTITQKDDIWILGNNRLMCGDSVDEPSVSKLLDGNYVDALVTDPPYCSGGHQESARSSGSIGTTAKALLKKRAFKNDTLSSRGYMAFIKAILDNFDPRMSYIFTDWRMWVYLFDAVESKGYGVRNMIVWDKMFPGMGSGWRTQHELVMFCRKESVKFDNHKAQGNVISSKRTGNKLHPTQKPTPLIEKILSVTDMAKTIADPFCGSGTMIIAAEKAERRCFGMEIAPHFCDIAVERWQDFTGKKAKRIKT